MDVLNDRYFASFSECQRERENQWGLKLSLLVWHFDFCRQEEKDVT